MKAFLLPHLICPACLPAERPLALSNAREADGDIVSGELVCRKCSRSFPISDGVAMLAPDPHSHISGGQQRYNDDEMLNRYLWSHYGDLAGVGEVGESWQRWGAMIPPETGPACDAGCAVGRLTFEMAFRSQLAVGFDLSANFIRAARRVMIERGGTFSLPQEGNLREKFHFSLPDAWRGDNLDFIVADAQCAPFARGSFQLASSLNLLDRVPYPLAHLYDSNRLLATSGACLLFGDPFSWSTSPAAEERWLGGTLAGDYPGRGIDNVRDLLQGRNRVLAPPWRITGQGSVTWPMRTHRNHCELITSEYLVAGR